MLMMIAIIILSNSALKIKIIGVVVTLTLVFIIKELIKYNIEKENATLQNLISNVQNKKIISKSILIDEFAFSTYDGFWQNFSSGISEENLFVKIYSDKLEFSLLNISIILKFKDIYKITYSTENRGRYDAITDKYINLSFNEENIIYLNETEEEANNLINLIKKWRIRKSKQKVYGNTGAYFEKILIKTLENYLGE